jgi:superfamily II DNA or RNA helicase
MIYAYTTPEIIRHNGWTKIGYTEQDVDKRLDQQTHTADVEYNEEWRGNAVFDDGSGKTFRDTDFHSYLSKKDIERQTGTEWFKILGPASRNLFDQFRRDHGVLTAVNTAVPYKLREEQKQAVAKTEEYFKNHKRGEYLWNAKPRFGKTLSVYDFCKQINAVNVLVVTNRPATANSWYSDYVQFLGEESGYLFVSTTPSLSGKPYVLTREEYQTKIINESDKDYRCIEFLSLQGLKGSIYFGGQFEKLQEVAELNWDVFVVDEAHEGVDTYKTDVAFDQIKRKFTLHLSGTPFKALANDKFPEDSIYNWTYADEQKTKKEWDQLHPDETNPYANLPKLNLFTYQMSEIIKNELSKGVDLEGKTEEYAFDLNEFFATNSSGNFIHNESVDRFLNALTTQKKFPYSTDELRNELKHTLWLLDRVDSAKALARKLKGHPVFSEYRIVVAAGDGKLDEDEDNIKSFDKVTEAIKDYEKTITLSVGQLTTGVTIPEWTGVLMLSNVKSPALYMQAAFRAQNPCLFSDNGQYYRKQNAYVFDFDPARTLTIFEEFANDLSEDTSDGRGTEQQREDNIRNLLNFFPVIGEDEDGKMIEMDAARVLSIPRKIRSKEVVRRGFMSDFLFQNISRVFNAPKEVLDILNSFDAVKEPKNSVNIDDETRDELSLDKDGNVALNDQYVIGQSADIFGDKIFDDVPGKLKDVIDELHYSEEPTDEDPIKQLKDVFKAKAVDSLISTAQDYYGDDLKASERKRLEQKLTSNTDSIIDKAYGNYQIQKNLIDKDRINKLNEPEADEDAINEVFQKKQIDAVNALKQSLADTVDTFVTSAGQDIVRTHDTHIREAEKKDIEDQAKNHLRGFTRTIPSFLMAYGDDETTLANFDQIIPDSVFKDVTSITLEEFRFLRDGGPYTNEETGEKRMFEGNIFEPIVFNDSVKEFLGLKMKLSDYFNVTNTEDIFDYIPPQKTNQIYTPKKIVIQMVDLLEQENPGCFDDPDKTFIDLYMKSGLYVAEIVKRLFNSEKMKQLFPDDTERLNHIFAKQVYGLAPTEIIYRIAMAFVLGFSDQVKIEDNNLRQLDALPYAKEGTLEKQIEKLYPGM